MPAVYEVKHGGCAILCGAAPNLFEDLAAARKLRPDATILGVKYAATVVPEITHVWTQHGEASEKIKSLAGRKIRLHARPRKFKTQGAGLWFLPMAETSWQAIDYVWDELYWVTGSSGLCGAIWARQGMGFDEVILAGIPLDPKITKYSDGYPNRYQFPDTQSFASREQIEGWLGCLHNHVRDGHMKSVYSMSGNTKRILGAPC